MRFCHVPTASPASFKRHEAAEQRRWGAAAVAAAGGVRAVRVTLKRQRARGGDRAEKRNSKEPEIASVRVSDSVLNMVILRGVAFYLYLIVFLVTLVNHVELWQGSALLEFWLRCRASSLLGPGVSLVAVVATAHACTQLRR